MVFVEARRVKVSCPRNPLFIHLSIRISTVDREGVVGTERSPMLTAFEAP